MTFDEILNQLHQLTELKGAVGQVALYVFFIVRLYRLPEVQETLPVVARWESLPVAARYGIVGTLAGVAGALVTVAKGGALWPDAFNSALLGALAAVAANKITKTGVVRAVADVVVPHPKD